MKLPTSDQIAVLVDASTIAHALTTASRTLGRLLQPEEIAFAAAATGVPVNTLKRAILADASTRSEINAGAGVL